MPLSYKSKERVRDCLQEALAKQTELVGATAEPDFVSDIVKSSEGDPHEVRDGTLGVAYAMFGDARNMQHLLRELAHDNYAPVLAWFRSEKSILEVQRDVFANISETRSASIAVVVALYEQCISDLQAQL